MREIIILERLRIGNPPSFRFAMWAAVPVARQVFYARPGFVSAWKDISGAELTAIQTGQVVEVVERFSTDQALTIAQIEAELQTRWNVFQNSVTNDNYWDRYGSSWDGTTWTLGGVA